MRALARRSVASALTALWSPSRRSLPAQIAILATRHQGVCSWHMRRKQKLGKIAHNFPLSTRPTSKVCEPSRFAVLQAPCRRSGRHHGALSLLKSPSRRPYPAQIAIAAKPFNFTNVSKLFIVKPSKTIVFYKLFQFFYSKTIPNHCVLQVFPVFYGFQNLWPQLML